MANVDDENIDTIVPTGVVAQLMEAFAIKRGGLEEISNQDQATLLTWAEQVYHAVPALRLVLTFGPDHVVPATRQAAEQVYSILTRQALPDVVDGKVVVVDVSDFLDDLGPEDCDGCDNTGCPAYPDYTG